MAEENKPENVSEPQFEVLAPTVVESIERAQIDMQISTARRYPRSLSIVKRRMMELVTLDEETAASCFYKLQRSGKKIEGPTIRLAEIAASSFGNIRFGARVVANDGKQITAQGFCHDLESNVMVTMEVRRRITDREGRTYSDDMQTTTGNAAAAIAARNAVFKVVPFAFVKPIFTAAKQAAMGDIKTLAERRTRTLDTLKAMGIDEKRACNAVGKNGVEEIALEELSDLFGLYNAVKDEEQKLDEAFPEVKKTPTFGAGLPETGGQPPDKEPDKEKRGRGRPKKPVGQPGEGSGHPTASEQQPPPKATPLEGLRNIMRTNNPAIEEKDLLTYLFGINKVEQGETLETIFAKENGDARIKMIIDQWPLIAPNLHAA